MQHAGRFALLLMLAAVGHAHANAVEDLRAKLADWRGAAPIAAKLSIEQNNRRGEGATAKVSADQAELVARASGDGLQLDYNRATLARLEAESDQRSRNPEAVTPLNDLLREASPMRITAALSYAPSLLRKLDQATLKEERLDQRDGQQRRLLVMNVPPNMPAKDRDSIKEYSGELKIWLDDAGLPLAIEQQQNFSGRRLLISFRSANSEKLRLSPIGGRLVVIHQQREQSFSGFGESNEVRTTMQLTPQ